MSIAQQIFDGVMRHPTVLTAVAIHSAHSAWNFWQDVGGKEGLIIFFKTGKKTNQPDNPAQPTGK